MIIYRRMLGSDFEREIREHIVKKYLGEQPLGIGFVLKSPVPLFKYVVVVSLFRMLSSAVTTTTVATAITTSNVPAVLLAVSPTAVATIVHNCPCHHL